MRKLLILIIVCFFTINITAQDTISLKQAIMLALENNFSILVSQNDLQIATNNNTAGNAGMLPQIAIDASNAATIFNTHQVYSDGRTRDKDAAQTSTLSARVMLNWTIFDGFSMFMDKKRYAELEKMGQAGLQLVTQNTIAQVIASYYYIAQQQKILESARDALLISTERLRLAKMKQSIGTGSDLSQLQAELDRNADSAKYLSQLNMVHNAKIDLQLLLAKNNEANFEVFSNIELLPELNYNDLLSKLGEQNIQLQAARLEAGIAAINVTNAKAAYYPVISVYTGYNVSNTTSQAGIFEVNRGQGPVYGLTASFNIFNGFNVARNVKNAKISQLSANYLLQQTELTIMAQFNKLYSDYQAGLNLVKLEIENQKAALRSTYLSFEMLKQGLLSDIDFRAVQQKQTESDIRLQTALYNAKVKETRLLLICGEIKQ